MAAPVTLDIQTPPWAEQFIAPARYKGIYGGRGSGKSHERAEAMVEQHILNPNTASVCLREYQKSVKYSVKRLIEQKMDKFNVRHHFDIQDNLIKNRFGDGIMLFQGMQSHNADSIKSLESFDIAWFEEAQTASNKSLTMLRPTLRKNTSEIWATWNPDQPTDAIDQLLRGDKPPPRSTVSRVNFSDNPWFPDVLREEMEYDRGRDMDMYRHVWLGEYKEYSEQLVLRNWTVEEFDTPDDAVFRFGADWGFSIDPTVLIRCFIVGRKLYVDYEAYQRGCDIVDTPDLFLTVPESERWPITADNSRPETISHLRKNGFPKIHPAIKGRRSVEEGCQFINSYDMVIHPRCVHTIAECSNYKYKMDEDTGEILPIIMDKDNHVIDSLRYALEGLRRFKKREGTFEEHGNLVVLPTVNYWN